MCDQGNHFATVRTATFYSDAELDELSCFRCLVKWVILGGDRLTVRNLSAGDSVTHFPMP